MSSLRSQRRPKLLRRSRVQRPAVRSGFTLVEMLVAVTLVLIMMTMFAQVFQMAGSSISRQRGLAENDQRSRTLTTIIKADLDKRSYRWVYPFAAGEDVSLPESHISKRQGYFYLSENSSYNTTDDTLQFTVVATITDRNKDETPYYGQAKNLASFGFANQPDADDAQLSVNNTGLSPIAEVAYFVRNGNLYRRQLLIRKPLATAGTNAQPTDSTFNNPNGKDLFDGDTTLASGLSHYSATGPFWNDFDYSAYLDPAGTVPSAHFLGSDSLDNSGNLAVGAIAAPYNRFGFSPFIPAWTAVNRGRPKEFAQNASGSGFIGRFTLEECSHSDFHYPQNTTSGGNIPTDPSLALTLDTITSTVTGPEDFSGGPRRGEDLLMTNVHSFDVQIWDDGVKRFVNIGDPDLASAADFDVDVPSLSKVGSQLNKFYGPRLPAAYLSPTAVNAVFDTWHPHVNVDYDGDGGTDELPPFLPRRRDPAILAAWASGASYSIGSEVFPMLASLPNGAPFFYRCIGAVDGGDMGSDTTSGASEPVWPKAAGLTIIDSNGSDTLVWQAVDNRKPLKAIKLEIRFIDPSTQQMRQLTLVHSLVD